MNDNSLIKTLQDTIESQNKTIEGLKEELKKRLMKILNT